MGLYDHASKHGMPYKTIPYHTVNKLVCNMGGVLSQGFQNRPEPGGLGHTEP